MAIFSSNKITQENESIAETLKFARELKKVEILEVSSKLQISPKYINALESGEFDKLPSGIYGKNFLKKYAVFLNIDYRPLFEVYDEIQNGKRESVEDPFSRKKPRPFYFLIIPKIIRNLVILLITATCLLYLGFYMKQITSPPILNITYPPEDLSISLPLLTVKGKTEPEAEVMINGEALLIDKEGGFERQIMLKNGLNFISIKSQKKYSKENIIVRKIMLSEQ
jgi:transcriptional regulator with XRE-family HTH domain